MLYSFFSTNIRQRNRKLLVYSLFILLVNTFVLNSFDTPLRNEVSPNGILSFELAKDISNSTKIINTWKEQDVIVVVGLNIGFDFFYLLSYSFFISIVIYHFSIRWKNTIIHKIGKILIWLISLAAIVDSIENISMIKSLWGSNEQIWVSIAYYTASMKFLFIFICIFYIVLIGIVSLVKSLLISK